MRTVENSREITEELKNQGAFFVRRGGGAVQPDPALRAKVGRVFQSGRPLEVRRRQRLPDVTSMSHMCGGLSLQVGDSHTICLNS